MKKVTAVLLCLIMAGVSMQEIRAKDTHTETDGNGNIETDLPWNQEIEGKIYGKVIGRVKDEDIDIDLPSKEEEGPPKDTGQTGESPGGSKDEDHEKPDNSTGQKPATGTTEEPKEGGEAGTSAIELFYPNITDANQQTFGIREDGTGRDGVVYYRWEEQVERLTIYPALVTKAKEEQKNIVMRVVDRKEKKMHYRLRLQYADIKDMKEETMRFEFGAKCEHKEAMYELAGTDDIVYLLQCKQEHIKVPVYIGVAVPEAWDHAYGVYQYALEQQDFIYIRKDLQIDEENVVEVKMAPGKDYVFAQQSLPVEDRSLKTWVSGLSGGSQKVDQKLALGSTAMFAAAGFLGVTLLMGVYMKKSGKGAWGKRSKES